MAGRKGGGAPLSGLLANGLRGDARAQDQRQRQSSASVWAGPAFGERTVTPFQNLFLPQAARVLFLFRFLLTADRSPE